MILLRRPKKNDSKLYFKWINNKRLVEYNSIFKPITYVEHLEWFSSISAKVDVKIFSIVEKKSKKLIGSCSLRKINKIEKSAELQIRIGESPFRNGGYGSEAPEDAGCDDWHASTPVEALGSSCTCSAGWQEAEASW